MVAAQFSAIGAFSDVVLADSTGTKQYQNTKVAELAPAITPRTRVD